MGAKVKVTDKFCSEVIPIDRLLFPFFCKYLRYDVCLVARGEIIRTVLCCIVY